MGVDRDSKEYIDFVVGDRSTKRGLKLWNKVKEQSTGMVATDYWNSYNEMIPPEKLIQTKAETECYSKSVEMMTCSLKLLMAKRNNLILIQIY